jgi:hypothetical protein
MKQFIKLVVLFFLVAGFEIAYGDVTSADINISEFNVGLSSRTNQLNWNIAGDLSGHNPNILSELTWTDIKTIGLNLNARAIINNRFFATGLLSYGWIYQGANQDSDYYGDNRTGEFSRSNNNASKGNTLDASIALGYQFIKTDQWLISGFLGFSTHNQYLWITDGHQTVNTPSPFPVTIPPVGSTFPDLNSSYIASWAGPWVGVAADCQITENLSVSCDFGYHMASYSGEGYWNLRPLTFYHSAQGNGVNLSLGINYELNDKWSAGLSLESGNWSAGPGTDITYHVGITQLNQVNWSFSTITLKAIHQL